MRLSLERDATKRQEVRSDLKHSLEQAKKFLPQTYEANPDLMWVNIVAATLQLGENVPSSVGTSASLDEAGRFAASKQQVIQNIDKLTAYCIDFTKKWVAHQRVYEVQQLSNRAELLKKEIDKATYTDWLEIQIPFRYDAPKVFDEYQGAGKAD